MLRHTSKVCDVVFWALLALQVIILVLIVRYGPSSFGASSLTTLDQLRSYMVDHVPMLEALLRL